MGKGFLRLRRLPVQMPGGLCPGQDAVIDSVFRVPSEARVSPSDPPCSLWDRPGLRRGSAVPRKWAEALSGGVPKSRHDGSLPVGKLIPSNEDKKSPSLEF